MLQNKDFSPTQALQPWPQCSDCPLFNDFNDSRHRGWCTGFDKITRTFHPRTNTCQQAIAQQTKQNPIEVAITLCSHELEIDPDDGHTFPKEQRVISLIVPEISRKAVMKAFEAHQPQFQGFYILDFNRCYPNAEF